MWKLWYKFRLIGWNRKTSQAKARWIAAKENDVDLVVKKPVRNDFNDYVEYHAAAEYFAALSGAPQQDQCMMDYKACRQQQRYYELLINPPTELPAATVVEAA